MQPPPLMYQAPVMWPPHAQNWVTPPSNPHALVQAEIAPPPSNLRPALPVSQSIPVSRILNRKLVSTSPFLASGVGVFLAASQSTRLSGRKSLSQ